jgi:predicted aspartyl protease
MSKVLAIYALLFLSAIPSNASTMSELSAAFSEDKDSTRLSFDPANNLIIITATLNGKGSFSFLLDTGASQHVMRPELARALGLKVIRDGGDIDAGARGVVKAGLAEIEEVRVGSLTLEKQLFFVTPFPASYPFDGFLGAELFKRFVVSIDFQHSLLTLTHPNAFRYQGAGFSLPLKFYKGLIPQVKAEVDDKAGWFKLDTGYNGSLALFGDFIERHNLLAKYVTGKSSPGGQTLTGEVGDSPVAQIRSFKLGDFAFADATASLFLEKGGSNSAFSGAIGTVLLKRFNVIIDYKRQRLILERRAADASVP